MYCLGFDAVAGLALAAAFTGRFSSRRSFFTKFARSSGTLTIRSIRQGYGVSERVAWYLELRCALRK